MLDVTLEDGTEQRIDTAEGWQKFAATRPRVVKIAQDFLDHEGVAVFTRPDICRATHAKSMREQGIRTVAELDDNYLSDSKFNVYMRTQGWDDAGRMDHMKATCSMDAIIVTTEWLRDYYYKFLKDVPEIGKKRIPPMHVCGNHIDSRYLVEPVAKRTDGKLRVGYMGSGQHVGDIRLIYPALKWAYDEGHEIVFVGINPAQTDPEWARKLKYTWVPWQKPEEYRRTALPLDIGLAPLLSNQHTFGKSDIKGLEYLLSGAAPILQNNVVYNTTFRHGETALLAGGREEFLYWTQQLCANSALRERLVADGNEYIRSERMIEQHKKEWQEAVLG